MHNVFIDIETLPVQCPDFRAKIVATAKPPANYSKPETIAKWREDNADEVVAKTALDPAAGHICSIGYAIGDQDVANMTAQTIDAEAAIIRTFFDALPQIGMTRFIGHYITGFDLRFIMCRAIVLGVKVPALWPRDPKPWDQNVFDTMTAWAGARGTIGLERLCEALGIESPKGDMAGNQVAAAWAAGEFDRIADYNRRDVAAVREVFRKFEAVGLV
jgi:3'-5' exonuclease